MELFSDHGIRVQRTHARDEISRQEVWSRRNDKSDRFRDVGDERNAIMKAHHVRLTGIPLSNLCHIATTRFSDTRNVTCDAT